jgi:hypothetical protein
LPDELLDVCLYARSIGLVILPVSEALARLSASKRPQRSYGGKNVSLEPSVGACPK